MNLVASNARRRQSSSSSPDDEAGSISVLEGLTSSSWLGLDGARREEEEGLSEERVSSVEGSVRG